MPKSYKWFALAAAQGDKEAAKKRDEIAAHLDAAALAAAQHAVKSFVAEPQPAEATTVCRAARRLGQRHRRAAARASRGRAGPLSLGAFEVGKR